MNAARPFAGTRLPSFITTSVLTLKSRKTQAEIATKAGFTNANVMSMLKAGSIRLLLDRVQPLARALEVDPSYLMLLALEQMVGDTDAQAIIAILGGAVTANEHGGSKLSARPPGWQTRRSPSAAALRSSGYSGNEFRPEVHSPHRARQ